LPAGAALVFAVVFDAAVALLVLVGSGFLAGAVLPGALVAGLAGALAAGFAVGLVGGFLAGALATGFAAGLETFLAGSLAVGFFVVALVAVLAGALAAGFAVGLVVDFLAGALAAGFAAGLETFFAGALDEAGLGLLAAALFLAAFALGLGALAFGLAAFAFGLAAGFLAAGFLGDGLDEGMGDGRWIRGMWIYRSHSLGTTEFPLAGGTKGERFRCVKVILKNKFPPCQHDRELRWLAHLALVIFGFEFPCGWLTLRVDMITLTERAATELKKLLAAKGETEGAGLRLAVTKGGCAGWQYEMQVGQPMEGDVLTEDHGARLIVAADSVERLRGCEVDFSDDLTDSGFKVHNPRAARSCGCGTSFEPLDEPPAGLDETPTEDCRA
jgi:iron-sulfur cluster assembly protein